MDDAKVSKYPCFTTTLLELLITPQYTFIQIRESILT